MKKAYYAALPIVAFVLILSNALFGHLLFGLPYGQDINKYSIYVHLQPEWDSYPGNILFEVTNVWSNPDPGSDERSHSLDPSDISSLTDYNSNQLQEQRGKSYVELRHEFSNCETNWKPILYRHAIDSLRNGIGRLQGTELGDDPYVMRFPNAPGPGHGAQEHREALGRGYVQFIPACISGDGASYDYAVSVNDPDVGFDVFFVPSGDGLAGYLESGDPRPYPGEGCSGENYSSFSGTCEGVDRGSGLLIALPDGLDQSLTRVRVSMHERPQAP